MALSGNGPPSLPSEALSHDGGAKETLWLLSAGRYNYRLYSAAKDCDVDDVVVVLVSNGSGNRFATTPAFAMMTLSNKPPNKWPRAKEVTPRARPFSRLQ